MSPDEKVKVPTPYQREVCRNCVEPILWDCNSWGYWSWCHSGNGFRRCETAVATPSGNYGKIRRVEN